MSSTPMSRPSPLSKRTHRPPLVRTALLLGSVAIATAAAAAPAQPAERPGWVAAWGWAIAPFPPGQPAPVPAAPVAVRAVPLGAAATPPAAPPPPAAPIAIDNPAGLAIDASGQELGNVTFRQVVRASAAGSRLRLRLSNENGAEALSLGAVHIALAGPGGTTLPGTDRVVTFAGLAGVNVPAGAPILSDPVDLPVKALDRLALSIHAPGRLPLRGIRSSYQYVAGEPGDHAGATTLPRPRVARAPILLTQLEIAPTRPTRVVVTFGDSITEGALSTINAFRGWPDRLAERLAAAPGRQRWAVVNAGIGGNRLLSYGTGPNALARFDRDVLSVPGVDTVILLEGINDIGRGFMANGAFEPVTAEALIAADRQIIERAHEHGIRVIGGTLTPYQGAAYASERGETVRQALNTWIRSSGAFDAVIDFEAAVADKANPRQLDPRFNDGDRLHPNDAGYAAMAMAIDLKLFEQAAAPR